MAGVTGIGGVFLRSADPERLASWYRENLRVTFDATHVAIIPDTTDAYSVLALFPGESTYIGAPERQNVMINFRVDDLVELRRELLARGVECEEITTEEYGLFTWTQDVDGNRVELWQPLS